MKRTAAENFRINQPYGIIIRLSDLSYSWFNRIYSELYNESKDHVPFFILHSFEKKLKNETILEELKSFAQNNRDKGMDMGEVINDGEKYLRIWLYTDKYFPYNSKGIIKKNIDRYDKVLFEIERIISSSPSSF